MKITSMNSRLLKLNLNHHLDQTTGQRQDEGVQQSFKILVVRDNSLIGVQGRIPGNQTNGYVNEVFRAHERGGDLREEREQDYVGDTKQQQEAEQIPYHSLNGVQVDELCLQSFQKGSPFKLYPDLILGFLGDRRGCHIGLASFLSLFSGRR